jgi:hypothetical protein
MSLNRKKQIGRITQSHGEEGGEEKGRKDKGDEEALLETSIKN